MQGYYEIAIKYIFKKVKQRPIYQVSCTEYPSIKWSLKYITGMLPLHYD